MFKHPFSFTGRISRTEYGISIIIYVVCLVIIYSIRDFNKDPSIVNMVSLIPAIPMFWFLLAQGAKRCHDIGKSGWYQIIPFYVFWMLFADSGNGINEYGTNPKEIGIQKYTKVVNQNGDEKNWIIVLMLIFWLLGILLTFGIFQEKNIEGLIVNWIVILTFSIILMIPAINIIRKTGKYIMGTLIRISLSISLIVFLTITTVSIIKYQSNCSERLAPNALFCFCRFENSNLTNKDLHGSDFTKAVFYKANLEGVNFENANLTNANLAESNLTNAKLTGVVMNGTNLQGTIGLNDETLCNAFKVSKTELSMYLSSRKIRLESDKNIGNSLKDVCSNKGVIESASYKQDSCFHPIVLYELENNSYSYKNYLPENFQPMAIRFCELVCIEEEKRELIQTCHYTGGINVTIERYQYQMNVIIKSAKTTELISQKTFYGQEPSECPETTTSSRTMDGSHVGNSDIMEWLKEFVNPPKSLNIPLAETR